MVDPAITARLETVPSQPFKSADALGSPAVFPDPTASPPTGSATSAQRNTRYAYLVGRLRNRQMTMEEATELYGIMDGMLRTSEAARAALVRSSSTVVAVEAAPRPKPAAPPPSAGSDDFLLMGILAMGAGAGLLAAMSKRLSDGPSSAPEPSTSNSRAKSR